MAGINSKFSHNTFGGSFSRVTEQQLQFKEEKEKSEKKASELQNRAPVLGISTYVRSCFNAAKEAAEQDLHERLLRCLRQKNGQYDPEILAKIRDAIPFGSENYRNITQIKCKAFEAWCNSSTFPIGDKCWSIEPSPDPELPEQDTEDIEELVTDEARQLMMQNGIASVSVEKVQERTNEVRDKVKREILKKAKLSSKRVEVIINDQLTEGNYYRALAEVILDMAVYPVCWLTGPEVRKRKGFKWVTDEEGNKKLTVVSKIKREYRRVSPFNVFPSPGSKNVQDGYLCELIDLKRSELAAMIGVEGFNEPTVRKVLQEFGTGGLREWVASDSEKHEAEYRPRADDDPNPPIQAVVYWGECPGSKLLEWGMDKGKVPDPDIDYQITAWLIGQYVVMARLNPSPLGTKPYYATSFDTINDSIIGNAIPEVMRDDQMRCCACARALDNNMAFASGPMFEMYKNRFAPGTDLTKIIRPFGILETEDDMQSTNNPAVRMLQVPSRAREFLEVDEYFLRQAGEKTIPSYVYGNSSDKGGVFSTASGTSMMMNASLKNLQSAIGHLEKDIIVPSIIEHWNHVMLYDDEIEKFGDIAVTAKASEHLLVEEQRQLRAQELLDRVDKSDTLKALFGAKGMVKLAKEVVKITHMDPAEMLPSDDEIEQREQAQLMSPVAQPPAQGKTNPAAVAPDGGQMGKSPGAVMQ